MKNTTIIFQVCPHTTTTIQHRTVNFALLIEEERLSIYFRGRPKKNRPRRKNITNTTTTTSSINTTIMGSASFSLLSSMMSKSQSLFLILLVLCYLEMGTTLVSASEATVVEAKIHDATGSTVNNNNQDDNDFKPDMKYLTESYQRLKRKASKKDHVCDSAPNKNLCLPKSYSKFELPLPDRVNTVEIGIDIIDVLRINDKVSFQNFISHTLLTFSGYLYKS